MERFTRSASLVEGASYVLLLFVAMPMKYLAGFPEAVQVAGTLHGALFVALAVGVAGLFFSGQWRFGTAAYVMLLAFVPFGALILERDWRRYGRLAEKPLPAFSSARGAS
ncbi:MAG: DUF3817 domain-containing protein [Myxococcota bacterium]